MDEVSRRYINQLPQPLSKIKLLILLTLLDAGNHFPRDWVESSKLLYLTNQKNFYKHIESLRDEFGCDIEMADTHGEQSYRLRSQARKKSKPKPKPKITLEDAQKEALLMFSGYACQVCGAKMIPGEIDLQADQKIPSKKGGGQELNNWQIICNECNGAGVIRVPDYFDQSFTAVGFIEYPCDKCDGEGWTEVENNSPSSTANIIIEY